MRARRPIRIERDLLDKEWLTYFLTFILILLIAIFALSLKYQDSIVQYVKGLPQHVKRLLHNRAKPSVPRPRPGAYHGKVEKWPPCQLSHSA